MRIVKASQLPNPTDVVQSDSFMAVRNSDIIRTSYESTKESLLHLTTDGSIFPTWVDNISDAVKYTMYHHNQFKNAIAAFEAGLAGEELSLIWEIVVLDDESENGTAGFLLYNRPWSFHEQGEVIELVAAPKLGYEFDQWTGDTEHLSNVNDPYATITANDNAIVTATFKQIDPNE